MKVTNDRIIQCKEGFYNHDNICYKCNESFSKCKECDNMTCSKCIDGYILNEQKQCVSLNCTTTN